MFQSKDWTSYYMAKRMWDVCAAPPHASVTVARRDPAAAACCGIQRQGCNPGEEAPETWEGGILEKLDLTQTSPWVCRVTDSVASAAPAGHRE